MPTRPDADDHLPADEERRQVPDDVGERRLPAHQVVLVAAVARRPCCRCCSCRAGSARSRASSRRAGWPRAMTRSPALSQRTTSRGLVHLGRGVLRVRVVDVQPGAVGEDDVGQPDVLVGELAGVGDARGRGRTRARPAAGSPPRSPSAVRRSRLAVAARRAASTTSGRRWWSPGWWTPSPRPQATRECDVETMIEEQFRGYQLPRTHAAGGPGGRRARRAAESSRGFIETGGAPTRTSSSDRGLPERQHGERNASATISRTSASRSRRSRRCSTWRSARRLALTLLPPRDRRRGRSRRADGADPVDRGRWPSGARLHRLSGRSRLAMTWW